MASPRQSFLISIEDEFGGGIGKDKAWIAPPPGAYFDSTNSRQTTRIQSTGAKTWDAFAYGRMTGSWNMTFMFDYDYPEPLQFIFEEVTPSTIRAPTGSKPGKFQYVFQKVNNKRVPSFTVRRVRLNGMAGGPTDKDEIVTLYGCVCTSVSFARASGSSQMQVNMSGFYADEKMELGTLTATDYQPYAGNLGEYSCLFIGEYTDEDNYVANTESLSISIDNSAEAIYNICTPIAKQFSEGITNYTFSTTAYANNPTHWEERVYSGGVSNDATYPWRKGLAPVPLMHILSYNEEVDMDDQDMDTHAEAFTASEYSLDIEITNCVIKSLQWQNGDGGKLQDAISSADCQKIIMTITTDMSTIGFTNDNPHHVTPVAIPAGTQSGN